MTRIDEEDQKALLWDHINRQMRHLLRRFGSEDVVRTADFWVDTHDWGTPQQKVYFRNLKMLRTPVIAELQRLLLRFPSWEIIIALSVPGKDDIWPDMGLVIRANEIIDGLQRQYLPREFQDIRYEGSRPGTVE